jgi:hypothetical protein
MKRRMCVAMSLVLLTVFGMTPVFAGTSAETAKTYYGRPVSFGGGVVRTYVTIAKDSTPTALGIEIPAKAFSNLPQIMSGLTLQFPDEARNLPFQYLNMDWNPQGHEPDHIYTVPHFDFHFYLQSPEATKAIKPGSCQGLDCEAYRRAMKDVPVRYRPADYRNVGAVVPQMGNHLIDPASPEFNNQPFTRTFLYGTYDGRVIFYEPMLTLQYLQSQPNEYLELKQATDYAQSGYYPTRYSVRYDPSQEVYRISLERFVYHAAR